MHIYRFSIFLEDNDDFSFEVDILPSQTFLDFHNAIQSVIKFSGTELASFYVSNNSWKKKTEISLIDMNLDEDVDVYEDDDENKPKKKKNFVMADTKIANAIQEPHQRFIYIYDFLTPWIFYVELMKIFEGEKSVKYPICSKMHGQPPVIKPIIPLKTGLLDGEAGLADFGDDALDDSYDEDENVEGLDSEDNELGDGFDELKF